jgi:hypothetical protein
MVLFTKREKQAALRVSPTISIKLPSAARFMINIEKIRVKTSLEKYANQ